LHVSFFGKMSAQAEVYIRVPGFISFASMACWHPTRPCAPRSCPARPDPATDTADGDGELSSASTRARLR
jgi:hypothetical protein